jgi:hypothetical protein
VGSSGQPWFVKRRIGFGWRPAGWQGWVITVLFLGSGIAAVIIGRLHKSLLGYIGLFAALGLYALIASAAARVAATAPSVAGEPIDDGSARQRRSPARTSAAARSSGFSDPTARARPPPCAPSAR